MQPFHPYLGVGVGLRRPHYSHIQSEKPDVPWFEIVSENYMDAGGHAIETLETIRAHYPVVLHGTSLSIGSASGLNWEYLQQLKALIDRIEPLWVSDHACWTGLAHHNLHDLLPLPYRESVLNFVSERVEEVQSFLGRPILLENVSSYLTYSSSEMPEWEFLAALTRRTGCGLLLDINNVYVNAVNHHFDPEKFIEAIPVGSVGQFHLAGHDDYGTYLYDTHGSPVCDAVWSLYRSALKRFGRVSTLIEWDSDIPEWDVLRGEAAMAQRWVEVMVGDSTTGTAELDGTNDRESERRREGAVRGSVAQAVSDSRNPPDLRR